MKNGKEHQELLARLARMYPDAGTALHFENPFQLLIATILSAQSTDIQVNKITARLFQKYRQPRDFAALTPEELAEEIKGCGLYRNKSKNIIQACRILLESHGGEVPRTLDELMALPGVGRKTANVVLSNAFGQPAIAVDTHVFRVANRLGLAKSRDVFHTEKDLQETVPKELWSQAHHWLIYHGRQVCRARNPKCEECALTTYCKFYRSNNANPQDLPDNTEDRR